MTEAYYIIFSVILGWLFGILSPGIIDRISNEYKRESLQKAIIGELNDLKKRLVLLPFQVNSSYGTLDKKIFIWVKEQTHNFEDPGFEDLKKGFEYIDNISEEELLKLFMQYNFLHKKNNPAFHFKKMATSIIDSNIINTGIIDNEFLTKILDLKFQINALNEEIKNVNDYLLMTFDSSITEDNHQIIKNEIENKNLTISNKAMFIVEKINYIIL